MIIAAMVFMIGFTVYTAKADAVNKNKFISKVYPITDKMDYISVDTTSDYYEMDSLTIKVGTKTYNFSYSDLWLYSDGKKLPIEFKQKFTAGNTVKIYANYTEYDEDYNDISKTVLVDTLKVSDKTAPKTTISNVTVRTTTATVTTEKNAKLSATYAGKKVALKKKSATKYTIALSKPVKGKKLVVKATDKAGNSKSYTTTTTVPKTIKITASNSIISSKTLKGKLATSKNTDYISYKIGSKTYKSKIKSGQFTIKFPANMTTPRNITLYAKDKYNNTLATKSLHVYKYATVKVGMTTSQVANSIYGKPADVSKHKYQKYTFEYWTYYSGYNIRMILSFENGKLESISKF